MSNKDLTFRPVMTLSYREIKRFLRVWLQTVATPVVNSVLYLLIFGVSLGGSISLEGDISYLAFLIPGLVMMSALNNAFQNTSSSIVISKFHGDLADLKVMPLRTWQIVLAMSLGGLFRGLIVGIVTLVVSEVFFFWSQGNWLPIQNPFLLVLFIFIGSLCFSNIGIAAGFYSKNFEKVNALGSFVLLPLLYLGGVFYSIEQLHPSWQNISKMNPLLYLINGVRYSVIGISDISIGTALIVSFISLVCLFFVSVIAIKRGSFLRW